MGYVGNQTTNSYTSMDKQTITGDGGTSYTLDHAVANVNEIEVFVNNVRQEPSVAYTVAGTALTMTGNVASSDDFYVVFQGKAIQTVVPPDGSVSTAKLASGAVTDAKIDTVAASKLTGALPAIDGSSLTGVLDYASGTFTPTFTGSGSDPTVSYNTQHGYYQRIGDYCYFSLQMGTGSKSGGSGDLRISGLPYTSSSTSFHGGAVGLNYTWNINLNPMAWYVPTGQSYMNLTRNNNNGTPVATSNMATGSGGNRIWITGFYKIAT